jgi:hypothetical protein
LASSHGASLAWSPVISSGQYNIYQDGAQIGSTNSFGSWLLGGLAPSSRYCVEVHLRPPLASAEEERSNEVCFFTPPTSPTKLQLTAHGQDAIALQWSADSTDASITGFRITRDDDVTLTVDGSTLGYDDVGLAPQTEHCYEVRSVNQRGDLSTQFDARRCLTTGWRNVAVVTPTPGRYPRASLLALDPAGSPVIVYVVAESASGQAGELWLARLIGDTWTHQQIGTGAAAPQIAIDGAAVIHVAYVDGAASTLRYGTNGGGWAFASIDDADASTTPTLIVEAAGSAHIAYVSAGTVRYATNRSGNWTAESIAAGRISTRNALALDMTGQPHVVLNAPNSDVQILKRDATAWSVNTAFPFTGGLCGTSSSSITFSTDNSLHLAQTQTCHAGGNVSHAQRIAGAWQGDVLPLSPHELIFRAGDSAIVPSADGRMHIANSASSFSPSSTGFVRYWTNSSGVWQGFTIANEPSGVSLRVDGTGNRHAVYVNSANEIRYLTTRP